MDPKANANAMAYSKVTTCRGASTAPAGRVPGDYAERLVPGLGVMVEMMEAEVTSRAGAMHARCPEREASRHARRRVLDRPVAGVAALYERHGGCARDRE